MNEIIKKLIEKRNTETGVKPITLRFTSCFSETALAATSTPTLSSRRKLIALWRSSIPLRDTALRKIIFAAEPQSSLPRTSAELWI